MEKSFTEQALRRLRLRHLELLALLGRIPTVRGAAEKLNLSQPAATKMLQEIEAACGATLFTRGRRGIEANAMGHLLIRHATVVINHMDATGQALDEMRSGSSGLLNVGSTSTMTLLSHAIARLRVEQPSLLVRITDEPPRQLIARLMAGELDCTLAPLPPDALSSEDAQQLRLEPITTDELCVVASPQHVLADRTRLVWGELTNEPWVLSPLDALTRQRFIEVYLAQGLQPPRPAVECVSFSSVRWLLNADPSLLALMRRHQAIEEAAMGLIRILPVRPVLPLPDVSVITRLDGLPLSQAMLSLMEALRFTARQRFGV